MGRASKLTCMHDACNGLQGQLRMPSVLGDWLTSRRDASRWVAWKPLHVVLAVPHAVRGYAVRCSTPRPRPRLHSCRPAARLHRVSASPGSHRGRIHREAVILPAMLCILHDSCCCCCWCTAKENAPQDVFQVQPYQAMWHHAHTPHPTPPLSGHPGVSVGGAG